MLLYIASIAFAIAQTHVVFAFDFEKVAKEIANATAIGNGPPPFRYDPICEPLTDDGGVR